MSGQPSKYDFGMTSRDGDFSLTENDSLQKDISQFFTTISEDLVFNMSFYLKIEEGDIKMEPHGTKSIIFEIPDAKM